MAEKLSQAKNIKLKLYLEGIKVPVSRVQITEEINKAPTCSIVMPLDEKILDLLPRTTVHVFYKDSLIETTNYKNEWILIFEGEVEGFNVSRDNNARNITVACKHISGHWNHTTKEPTNFENPFNAELTTKISGATSTDTNNGLVPKEVTESAEIVAAVDNKDILDIDTDEAKWVLEVSNNKLNLIDLKTAIAVALDNSEQKIGELMKKFAHSYGNTNVGYNIFHTVYQMVRRFKSIDNSKIDSIIDLEKTRTMLRSEVSNIDGGASLVDLMFMALDIFDYKLIVPTAPTFNESNEVPESFLFAPTTTLFAPPACNIIFQDEILTSNFSKSMLSEPTRMVAFIYPRLSDIGADITRSAANTFTVPTNEPHYEPLKTSDGSEDFYPAGISLTREERLRGINGQILSDDASELRAQLDSANTVGALKEDATADEKKAHLKELDDYIKKLRLNRANSQFQKEKLGSSNFNITTYYSPFRMVGFPGVCMDNALPNIMGVIGSISSVIDANGQASSQITFVFPKFIREEGKVTAGFEDNSLDELLSIYGYSGDVIDNYKDRLWPFFDAKYTNTDDNNERWKKYLIEKLNNFEDQVFLNTWHDPDKFFPNKIGTEVYREVMYGLDPDADSFDDKYGFEQEFFSNIDDGGIGLYGEESPSNFDIGSFDNRENTNWLAYYLKTIKEEYDSYGPSDKHGFIHKTTRRRIITESEFWQFLLNLDSTAGIDDIDDIKIPETAVLGFGIRSVNTSLSEERGRIKELLDYNGTASAPFIEERRAVVRQLKSHLERTPSGDSTYIVGVTT